MTHFTNALPHLLAQPGFQPTSKKKSHNIKLDVNDFVASHKEIPRLDKTCIRHPKLIMSFGKLYSFKVCRCLRTARRFLSLIQD